jgi:hypothetical protein
MATKSQATTATTVPGMATPGISPDLTRIIAKKWASNTPLHKLAKALTVITLQIRAFINVLIMAPEVYSYYDM